MNAERRRVTLRLLGRAYLWILAATAVGWLALPLHDTRSDPPGHHPDALAYALAAERVHEGESPYAVRPPPGPHTPEGGNWYLYPPPLAVLLAPSGASERGVFRIVALFGVLGTAALAWTAVRVAGFHGFVPILAVMGGLLLFDPYHYMLGAGNVHGAVLGASAAALLLSPPAAAALLLSGAVLKITPAWPLAVVLARQRSAWRGLIVTGALLLGAMLLVATPAHLAAWTIEWARSIAPTLSQGQFWSGEGLRGLNVSPTFAPLYLLGPWPEGTPLPAAARAWLGFSQLAAPVVAIVLTRRADWRVQAGAALVAAAVFAPIFRMEFTPVLLLPVAWAIGRHRARREPPVGAQVASSGGLHRFPLS